MRRPIGRATAFIAAAAATILFASVPPPTDAATAGWTLAMSTASLNGPSTKVVLTVTDVGGSSSTFDIGCVEVSIPPAVDVSAHAISGVTNGRKWVSSLASGNPSVVTANAKKKGDRLQGGNSPDDAVDIAITVDPTRNGATTWTVAVFHTENCTSASGTLQALAFTVGGAPAPTPTPTPTPAPTPKPTPTPAPTPKPTPTPAPTPKPTPTPAPTPTGAPTPTPAAGGSSPTPTPRSTPPGSTPASATPAAPVSGATAAPTDGPPGQPSPASSSNPGPSSTGITGVPPAVGGGTGGPGTGGAGTPDTFTLGGTGSTEIGAMIHGLGPLGLGVEWGVPAFVMGVPGLLIILVILAQALGGSAWLPLVRRRIGSFGVRGPRLARRT